jgi:hypothetical protein
MKTKLIIVGSAPCVAGDLADIKNHEEYDFMAIGLDAIDKYPGRIKFLTTYHPEDLVPALERREAAGGNTDYITISSFDEIGNDKFKVDVIIRHEPPSGSSALHGALAAVRVFDYEKVILAGCPLEGQNAKGIDYNKQFSRGWEVHAPKLQGKVRSMSGWTRCFLGGPTKEWLNG